MSEDNTAFLDRMMKFLWDNATNPDYVFLEEKDLSRLADLSIEALKKDKTLLYIKVPLSIVGDLHGQFTDLMKFLEEGKKDNKDPKDTTYLFLGDYVDRGNNSCATLAMLLCLKCRYPDHIFLLRGNHETRDISKLYGFYDEICSKYPTLELWEKFNNVFDYMPLAAIVGDRIFCVHGGLSRSLNSLDDIQNLSRPLIVPDSGLIADLLWADPLRDSLGYQESERGTSYTFGPDVAESFLKQNDFDLICRAHQVVNDGFEFPFYPTQSVVTVFSAPNYCDEYQNKGAMLMISDELVCSFKFVVPPNTGEPQLRPDTPAARM